MATKEQAASNMVEVLTVEMQRLLTGADDKRLQDVTISDQAMESDVMVSLVNQEMKNDIHHMKREGKHAEAITAIKHLLTRQNDPVERFLTNIELIEMYCKEDKVVEAFQEIVRLRKNVEGLKIPPAYLRKLKKNAFEAEKYVRAFLYAICQNCDVTSSEIKTVPIWVHDIIEIVDKLKASYNLVCSQLIVPLLHEMHTYHDVLKNSNAELAVNKAWLMYGVAVCRGYLKEEDEMTNTSKQIVQLMDKFISKECAPNYRVYGLALVNLKDYKKAVTALTQASDWPREETKQKCINSLKTCKL